jgi:acyl-CoA thioesterase-1
MAGYGLPENEHLSFQLERDLELYYNLDANVINGSVSGDTSSSGLNRLEWTLPDKIDLVILCLGANDMLRGINPDTIKKNLQQIISIIKSKKINILLAGIQAPESYGEIYKKDFDEIFYELSKENDITFMPFLLEGVALNASLNQPDGMHPNFKGVKIISNNLATYIEKLSN